MDRRLPSLARRNPSNDRSAGRATVLLAALTVSGWYGERERTVAIVSGTCVWYHTGMPAVPMRWVLIRDPEGKFETQALLCTRLEVTPVQVFGIVRLALTSGSDL